MGLKLLTAVDFFVQKVFRSAHKILVLIAYVQKSLNAHADVSSVARVLKFCLSLYLHPSFVYTSLEESD